MKLLILAASTFVVSNAIVSLSRGLLARPLSQHAGGDLQVVDE
jgi:hypothetical protein